MGFSAAKLYLAMTQNFFTHYQITYTCDSTTQNQSKFDCKKVNTNGDASF